jgi:hypothetical protein
MGKANILFPSADKPLWSGERSGADDRFLDKKIQKEG